MTDNKKTIHYEADALTSKIIKDRLRDINQLIQSARRDGLRIEIDIMGDRSIESATFGQSSSLLTIEPSTFIVNIYRPV